MRKAIIAAALASALALAGCGSSAASSASAQASSSQAASSTAASDDSEREAFDSRMFGVSTFYDEVRNDKTGNWRCYVYMSDMGVQEIAADYWKAYAADGEVHALVNLGLKTSASVTGGGGQLYVDVYDYVDGEEHDADKMFTGQKLASYIVDMGTGEAEKV